MQPVYHVLFLADARIRLVGALSGSQVGPLFRGFVEIGGREPDAHEENITDVHVAALRRGAEIDALVLRASLDVGQGDDVVGMRVIQGGLATLLGIGPVVEQDAAAGNTVLGPVVHGALVRVGFGAHKVFARSTVVEEAGGKVGAVAQTVKLGARLGVQSVDVIVDAVRAERLDGVGKGLAVEDGWIGQGWGHVHGDDVACLYGGCGGGDAGWSEQIDAAQLVIGAPDPSCIFGCIGRFGELFAGGKSGVVGVPGEVVWGLCHCGGG